MKKIDLRRIAYIEASQSLRRAMDTIDLPEDLSERDEDYVREFIRTKIADSLEKKASPR